MKISNFAKRLKQAMEIRRMSQTELHDKTGIGKSSISTYLKGEYKAKQDKVDLMAEALDVDPAWLMGYDVPMDKTQSVIINSHESTHAEIPTLSPALQRYSEILKEAPEIEDVVESYASLDKEDRGVIRGEIKGMLRAEKYSYSSRIKDDTAI